MKPHDGTSEFEVPVYFGGLNPDFAQVEVYADPLDSPDPVRQIMTRGETLPGSVNAYLYRADIKSERPAEHFSFRIVPFHPAACIPLEDHHILWYSLSH